MIHQSSSPEETQKIAGVIANLFKDQGGIITLTGELAAGKTTFTQGFAKALGITDKIISPTFVLIRQHPIPNSKKWLFHIDLYRLSDNPNIKELGLQELFDNPNAIILIEWAEKISNQLPKNITKITFEKTGESDRKITVS